MQHINVDSYQSYLQYLQRNTEEHIALLNDVLVNFTGFFRDRDAWSYLATEVIPKNVASKQPHKYHSWPLCTAGQQFVYHSN